MRVQNNSSINFQARVSDDLLHQLNRQLRTCKSKKKSKAIIDEKLKNIGNWGDPKSSIVITQDFCGNCHLGLQYLIRPMLKVSWEIKNLTGKKELSQFLALKESNIVDTENTIKYLYSKYGRAIFDKYEKI